MPGAGVQGSFAKCRHQIVERYKLMCSQLQANTQHHLRLFITPAPKPRQSHTNGSSSPSSRMPLPSYTSASPTLYFGNWSGVR